MKVIVDKDTCIGCGLCCGVCPEVFSMDDEDKAEAERPRMWLPCRIFWCM